MSKVFAHLLDLGALDEFAPDAEEPLPQWRRRLVDHLMTGALSPVDPERADAEPHRCDAGPVAAPCAPLAPPADDAAGGAVDEMSTFAEDIAHQQVEVLAHQLLGGDLSLWASARGDADRAAALRDIERDLREHVRHEVEVARTRVLRATLRIEHRIEHRASAPAGAPGAAGAAGRYVLDEDHDR